jgi:chemotaxis protein methyltransferase CheR
MSHRRNGAAMALADVALPIVETEREFDFTDADFRSLVKLAHEHAGISLAESKRNLVYSRLSRRLRALGLRSFHDYRDYLAANSAELESFINAISTNLTKSFVSHITSSTCAPTSPRASRKPRFVARVRA